MSPGRTTKKWLRGHEATYTERKFASTINERTQYAIFEGFDSPTGRQ
jgi:hypothetical protein